MIGGVTLKVCGITSAADAAAAAAAGADWLGFIFHPASPRHLSREHYAGLKPRLPATTRRTAVVVEPTPVDLAALAEFGFDAFQVHFHGAAPIAHVVAWAETVGRTRLWLAPRLAPGAEFQPAWLPYAETFLIDTYHPEKVGGTGSVGDWPKFAALRTSYPDTTWILSGGLTPANLASAVTATRATFVDVNSGVEAAPGRKDAAKLAALAGALTAR